jgi:ribosome-associated protein
MIANGEVTVDGRPESRKTAKIRANQTVQCLGRNILTVAG